MQGSCTGATLETVQWKVRARGRGGEHERERERTSVLLPLLGGEIEDDVSQYQRLYDSVEDSQSPVGRFHQDRRSEGYRTPFDVTQ